MCTLHHHWCRKFAADHSVFERVLANQQGKCPVSLLPLPEVPHIDHIGTERTVDCVIRGATDGTANHLLGMLESLEKKGADLRKLTAPHIYEYSMKARRQQLNQMFQCLLQNCHEVQVINDGTWGIL